MLLLFFPRLYIQSVSFSIFNTFFKQHRDMYLSALMLKIYWVRFFNRGLFRFPSYWQLTRTHAHLSTLSFVLPYQLCCIVLSISVFAVRPLFCFEGNQASGCFRVVVRGLFTSFRECELQEPCKFMCECVRKDVTVTSDGKYVLRTKFQLNIMFYQLISSFFTQIKVLRPY